ncbi:MAG: hypothetical protein QM484_13495 [Woeseiaceae bacterium]
MKNLQTTLFALVLTSTLAGCNSMPTRDIATNCEQGIESLNQRLLSNTHSVNQTNLSRANSLLLAAQVQLEFAEFPGCMDKIKRAQDYLSGRQAAIISRLAI